MTANESVYANTRQAATELWHALAKLKALQPQWNALDLGNTLPPGTGADQGITAAQLGAVIFDTADAITVVMNSGHATNVAKLLY